MPDLFYRFDSRPLSFIHCRRSRRRLFPVVPGSQFIGFLHQRHFLFHRSLLRRLFILPFMLQFFDTPEQFIPFGILRTGIKIIQRTVHVTVGTGRRTDSAMGTCRGFIRLFHRQFRHAFRQVFRILTGTAEQRGHLLKGIFTVLILFLQFFTLIGVHLVTVHPLLSRGGNVRIESLLFLLRRPLLLRRRINQP